LKKTVGGDVVKSYYSKVLTGAILIAIMFFSHNAGVDAAQITKTLDNDTKITPPGIVVATWSEIPKFKKGTVVTLNMYGEVLEGILADDVDLRYETGIAKEAFRPTAMAYTPPQIIFIPSNTEVAPTIRVLPFKGGTKVLFNEKGEVIKGTVNGANHTIILDLSNHINVSEGELSFYKNGMVASCTLANDTFLRPVGWAEVLKTNFTDNAACPGFVEFKAGPVLLNEKGEVTKGTLNKDTKLRSGSVLISPGGLKVYEAGTTVEFDEQGVVTKATKG
jgi:hypothetical protein